MRKPVQVISVWQKYEENSFYDFCTIFQASRGDFLEKISLARSQWRDKEKFGKLKIVYHINFSVDFAEYCCFVI